MASASRSELMTVVQRVVDLVVKVISGRIELTATEVRDGAGRARRGAGLGLAGALMLVVGFLLLAGAAVDALAPWVVSRPLRLLIVAAPFVIAGTATVARARLALLPQKRYVQKKSSDPTPASPYSVSIS